MDTRTFPESFLPFRTLTIKVPFFFWENSVLCLKVTSAVPGMVLIIVFSSRVVLSNGEPSLRHFTNKVVRKMPFSSSQSSSNIKSMFSFTESEGPSCRLAFLKFFRYLTFLGLLWCPISVMKILSFAFTLKASIIFWPTETFPSLWDPVLVDFYLWLLPWRTWWWKKGEEHWTWLLVQCYYRLNGYVEVFLSRQHGWSSLPQYWKEV